LEEIEKARTAQNCEVSRRLFSPFLEEIEFTQTSQQNFVN
jgi:hypothetical protein